MIANSGNIWAQESMADVDCDFYLLRPASRVKIRGERVCRGGLRMRFLRGAILILAAIAFAGPATAEGPRPGGGPKPGAGTGSGSATGATVTGFNPDQIAQLFNTAGFKSQVVDNNKTKMVQASFWDANDIFSGAFGIYCNDKGQQCGGMTTFANLGKVDAANAAWVTPGTINTISSEPTSPVTET